MSAPKCYFAVKGGLEDRIASSVLTNFNKEQIAILRGLYEMETGNPLIPEGTDERKLSAMEVLEAANKLTTFKENQAKNRLKEMKDSTKHIAKSFAQLYNVEGWSEAVRRNRINMIAMLFTAKVSQLQAQEAAMGNNVSRDQIINGYKANGQYHHGQFSVFEGIFNSLWEQYNKARRIIELSNRPAEELAKLPEKVRQELKAALPSSQRIATEYPKIFQNWSALCTFARMTLRDTEGLKLGTNTLEYAAPTSTDNFSLDGPLEDIYNVEESVKEAWMQHQSEISLFASLSKEVRKFLATIVDVDERGQLLRDDLGFPICMDPISTRQYLADALRGMTSESGVIKKLHSLALTDPKMNAVFNALANAAKASLRNADGSLKAIDDTNKPANPVILTQLFVDMHKNTVPYTALIRNKAGKIIAKVLNKTANPLHGEFLFRVEGKHTAVHALSVYDKEGKVHWENLAKLRADVMQFLPTPKTGEADETNIFASKTTYQASSMPFYSQLSYKQRVALMHQFAQMVGMDVSENTIRKIYNNAQLRGKFLRSMRNFVNQTYNSHRSAKSNLDILTSHNGIRPSLAAGFTVEQINAYNNALEALNQRKMDYNFFLSKAYGANAIGSNGSGYEEINKMLDTVADVTVKMKTERRIAWFDRYGKSTSRYSDRTPSYMGDMVDEIHTFVNEGDAQGLKDYIMDKWGQSSFFYDKSTGKFLNSWLQEMYDSIKTDTRGNVIIDKEAFARVFQFEEFLGSNIDHRVSIFENFTEKQHAEAMLKHFLDIRDYNAISTLAKYPCFILGDSGAQMFFTARHYDTVNGDGVSKIMEGMKNVFRQEIERRKYVTATNKVLTEGGYKLIDNFSQTENEFTMLTFFNPSFKNGKYWKILTGNQDMSEAELKGLTPKQTMDMAVASIDTDALTEALQTYMNDALADFMTKLVDTGVLIAKTSESGDTVYSDASGIFQDNLRPYQHDISKMVKDFFYNTKYATIQQLQMFTVDPAFYDHRYPVKDLQKRYKEIYAPGKGLSLEARDLTPQHNLYTTRPYETVVYFDDIDVDSKDVNPYFYNVLEKTFGENSSTLKLYSKNTLTDGQAYRTLDSYRAVKGMASEWTQTMENAYQRIKVIQRNVRENGMPLTENDIKTLSELAVLFQPIKPYLYTLEKLEINKETGDTALIPVQHKYAEIVLIPELLMDGKLKDMALWMENHTDAEGKAAPIDMVASTKCVKVGAFGSVALKGANTTEAIEGTLNKAFVHNLPWADYRVQSGVPEHLNHAQLFGTQIRKLILAGIDKKNPYPYLNKIFKINSTDPNAATIYLPGMGNVHLTGSNLISLYNSLIMANMFDSYDTFANQVVTNKNLSDKLLQNIVSNSNQAEDNAFAFSLIEDGEFKDEFLIPLAEAGVEHDAVALLWSLFKKNVNKQKIKGGSAVQASAMGLSGYEESGDLFEVVSPDGDNVLYDEIEMPFNCSYLTYNGQSVSLKFEDWCNPDGTLKVADANGNVKIVHDDEALEYLSFPVSGRDKYGRAIDPSQGYYVPLIEQKYPGILDIIAYRIPTEMEYSMVNCKVFRFSNPITGGTMKIPSSRTTTGGFDFDIDKLYFFMREFAQTHLSDSQIEGIWNAIYDAHPQWKEALEAARQKDADTRRVLGEDTSALNARLHHFWQAAGLPGTDSEAFTKYLEDHRREYPLFDTYNPEVSPLNPVKDDKGNIITPGNSRVARNNLLIDLMRARLMDKETLKQRYTPGGFKGNSRAALSMRILKYAPAEEITTDGKVDWKKVNAYIDRVNDKNDATKDPEPEFDVSDPTTILTYNQQNQIAGKLIGIFANQNTNHVYASLMHTLQLDKPIYFGDHASTGLHDFLNAPEGIDVDVNVAEYLAASVDAVKDPVLNYLNLNLVTADAGAMLARIGYTPMEIGLLFNQPIIKDVCTYVANNGVTTDVAILEMVKKYGGQRASLKNIKYLGSEVSTDKLANTIFKTQDGTNKAYMDSTEFKNNQLQVLSLFNEILADTADVNSFVQSTRFTAANSIGSTYGDQIAQEQRVAAFLEKYGNNNTQDEDKKPRLKFQLFDSGEGSQRVISIEQASIGETNQGILNNADYLLDLSDEDYMAQMSKNPLAFEQCMMDLTRKAARKLFDRHFPYHTDIYKNMRQNMQNLTKYGTLDADTINSLHREFMVYLLSRQKGSIFDGEAANFSLGTPITNRQYYSQYFPLLLNHMKASEELNDIPFFNAVTSSINEFDEASISIQGMGGLESSTSNMLTEMWADACNSDRTVYSSMLKREIPVSSLAKDLFFYNYYRMGFNFHPTVFMNLVPTVLKQDLRIVTSSEQKGYINFIRDIVDGKVSMSAASHSSFMRQYILNHLDNNKFVLSVKGTPAATVQQALKKGGENATFFTLSRSELNSDLRSIFLLNNNSLEAGEIAFRPVIAIEDTRGNEKYMRYFIASSGSEKFNVTSAKNGSMTYKEVYAQGTKGKNIAYYNDSNFARVMNGEYFTNIQKELNTQYQQNQPAPAETEAAPASETESSVSEAPEAPVENGYIEIQEGDDVSNMFTEEEWKLMFKRFVQQNPLYRDSAETGELTVAKFRQALSDTSDSTNRLVLSQLTAALKRGQKMETINENGEKTTMC